MDAGPLARVDAVSLTSYSGPLPHPEVLQQYEQTFPGAARMIFEDFLQESTHRRRLEERLVRTDDFVKITGSISASLIGVLGVGGGLWLLHEGRSLAGLSSVVATLASLLGVYLYQQHRQSPEPGQGPEPDE